MKSNKTNPLVTKEHTEKTTSIKAKRVYQDNTKREIPQTQEVSRMKEKENKVQLTQ